MLLLIVFLALFLRVFRFPELSWLFGDQGIDLMVAQRALHDGVWPMVGPYLGVKDFFVPPTYYWILTVLLWIGKTPEAVTLFFVGMDILALILLYHLARALVDKKTGYIAAGLWAISTVTITHARSMWQPHPVQLFLVASLFFLHRKSIVVAWSLYGIVLSIYPSPIVLLPFFLYYTWQLVKWFRGVEWLRTVCFALLAFSLPFLPWVIFEAQRGWPTYAAFFTGSFGLMQWRDIVLQFFLNLIGIFGMTTGLFSLHQWFSPLVVPVFIALFFVTFIMAMCGFEHYPRYRRTFHFLAPWWFMAGFVPLLLFRDMGAVWHRLYGFLPFVFLTFALLIRLSFTRSSAVYRWMIAILVSLYIIGNGLTFWEQISIPVERYANPMDRSRRVAVVIDDSAQKKGLNATDFSVVAYIPTDIWSYAVAPELYFLREIRDYPILFTRAGNDLDRSVWGNDGRSYIYLLCKEYTRQEDIEHTCLGTFRARNPTYRLEERLFFAGDTTAFLFRRSER